jgi:Ser/Thr protein kinase RdoA (MazF antagonist)
VAGQYRSSRRTELAAARRLARAALAGFGIDRARMRVLRHEHNTTFRVDTDGATFVLRINRPGVHDVSTVASEMAWLRALASGTQLGVPEPVSALDGAAVVPVLDDRAREQRTAVLLRWQDGRFVDSGLTPRHLRQVAVLQAGLQHHAASWDPPDAFVRPRVDTLTTAAKRRSIAPGDTTAGTWPAADDADEAVTIVGELLSRADAAIVSRALDVVWATTTELAARPEASGLIHGDLHYENFLFRDGAARAIDFDDCGWGFYLYDVAVTLWELEERARYAQLCDAFLEEYERHRPLPPNHDVHLRALFILRRIQMLMWIIESRRHSSFRDHWRAWAEDEIGAITIAVRRRSQ